MADRKGKPSGNRRVTKEQGIAEGWFVPNESGLCECGCGQRTSIAAQTHRASGQVSGEPLRYRPGHFSTGRAVPAEKRFWPKVSKQTDCWLWTGHRTKHGHGQFGLYRRLVYAHRYAFEVLVRPLEPGEVLHHKCGEPSCVNPDHLEPMTQAQHAALHAAA